MSGYSKEILIMQITFLTSIILVYLFGLIYLLLYCILCNRRREYIEIDDDIRIRERQLKEIAENMKIFKD